MFKKSLASIVSAAVLVAGPGHLTLDAAAQTLTRGPVTGVSVTPTIGTGLNSPVPGASSFNMPSLTPGALLAPTLTVAPKPVLPAIASPVSLAPVPASLAARPIPAAAKAMPLTVIASRDAKVGVAEKGAALNALFENSTVAGPESLEVLGRSAASADAGLSRAEAASAKSPVSIERAAVAKGSAAGELAVVSLVKRAWNALLGIFGLGVKKMETPEVMAQRIIDQLNDAKPVYNRKVQEASTLVEKLKLQVEGETAKVAELERGITALLSDSDPANDIMASGMINQQKTLNASITSTNEQIVLAEATLASIKEERARFFSEREETIAKIQAGLTKSAAADIQKQIAELKGGFQVGDLKDNMDKFEDAVNDKVADAKGTADSVDSNPDQILKKAKDSLKSQEIKDELARRKAAIEQAKKDKGQAGGGVAISAMKAVGVAVNVVMAVWAGLNTGWIAMILGAGAVMGVVMPLASLGGIALGVFAEKVMKTSGAKTAGMAILGGVIGFGLGLVAVGIGGYVGYAVASQAAAIGLGVTALVTSLLDVAFKSIFKKDKPADKATLTKAQWENLKRYDVVLTLSEDLSVTQEDAIVYLLSRTSGVEYRYDREARTIVVTGIEGRLLSVLSTMGGVQSVVTNGEHTSDKGQAGGKISSYPAAVYILGTLGLAVSLVMPVTALTVVAVLGALTLADTLTAAGNLDKSTKFYAFSIGAGVAALITLGISGFGAPFYLAGGAAVLANVLGKVHKAISLKKSDAGGLILELGIGAAVIAVLAAVSAPFRGLLARAWNATLGMLGLGVKKMETPEVMAQRIIDQLNSQKPVYNRKVQEASTLVEKLRLQIEKQTAQSAELDRSVTAILSDSDPLNDVMAESLLNQKKTVDASTALTKEQLVLSEKTLVDIKEERARFFSEREEMLAKIQAGLTKSKSAEIQKQIAELKGGFSVGDLKDNMDRFEDAVNDKVADAKGTVDSVESNPDQILKKAKDSLKNQEVQDEIAKRKAAIEEARKAKGSAGGDASQSKALGYFAKVVGIGFALISPWISAAVYSVLGLVAIAMAPEQGRWLGRQLAVIGLGTLVIGGAASLAVAKLGLAVGAFGVGVSFLVPAGIALAIGVIATLRANKKDGATLASAAATPAGSSVTPAPVAAPAEASAPVASSPKASFSIKPLLDLIARAWNALLGVLGMGVKKMETPEVMAQRLIDQLNAAKPVYNNKVKEASTLVEALRQQIAGEQAKIADFDRTITALLSDNDPSNDIQAAGLLNSQKTLEASVAASKEQLAASEKALENIKGERARFFSEREETLAKIQSGLTKVKAAEIQKEIAELKGGFQVGDLKDNMDRFEDAVNDKVADAKGTVDSVESNPDQILKKAKDSLKNQEVQDEIAKRKAAIEEARKAKGSAGGSLVAAALGAGVLGGLVTGVVAYLRASRAHPGNGWNGFTALKAAAVGAAVAGLLGGAAALLLPAAVLQSLGLLLSAVAASGVAQVLGLAVASATVAGIVSLLRAERSSPGNGWNGFRAAKAAVIAGGAGLALGLLLVVLL